MSDPGSLDIRTLLEFLNSEALLAFGRELWPQEIGLVSWHRNEGLGETGEPNYRTAEFPISHRPFFDSMAKILTQAGIPTSIGVNGGAVYPVIRLSTFKGKLDREVLAQSLNDATSRNLDDIIAKRPDIAERLHAVNDIIRDMPGVGTAQFTFDIGLGKTNAWNFRFTPPAQAPERGGLLGFFQKKPPTQHEVITKVQARLNSKRITSLVGHKGDTPMLFIMGMNFIKDIPPLPIPAKVLDGYAPQGTLLFPAGAGA